MKHLRSGLFVIPGIDPPEDRIDLQLQGLIPGDPGLDGPVDHLRVLFPQGCKDPVYEILKITDLSL